MSKCLLFYDTHAWLLKLLELLVVCRYALDAQLDTSLVKQLIHGKLFVGQKLRVWSDVPLLAIIYSIFFMTISIV